MADHTEGQTISYTAHHWVEFTDIAINLTGIPEDQIQSGDDDGQPATETESMSIPLIEFD